MRARNVRAVALGGILLGLVGITGVRPQAQAPATPHFYAMGDLPGGGTSSTVRDATRVSSGAIYAVGAGSANTGSTGTDTPVLWQITPGSAVTLTALPNIVINTSATNSITASAITPDGAYIASQARSGTATERVAVRVTSALVPFPSANLNLNAVSPSGAIGLSSDGSVLYGNVGSRAARFDLAASAGNVTIPLLRAGDTNNQIALHGVSADGRIAAGVSFAASAPGRTAVFRYVWNPVTNTGTLTGLPFAPGGNRNRPLTLSPDGRYTLLSGNSSLYPNGEVYVHDAVNGTFAELGSPNSASAPAGVGGMTADGSVVAVSFFSTAGSSPGLGYIHNQHGWFTLSSILREAGITNLRADGWDIEESLNITGISPDGTLLYGAMPHNGSFEGFVIDFPAGYLANFDRPATPVSNTAIVGAWTLSGWTPGDGSPGDALVFLADGTYMHIASDVPSGDTDTNGVEAGTYAWDATTGTITFDTRIDTNGTGGPSGSNDRLDLTATVSGNSLSITIPGRQPAAFDRVPADLTGLAGGWAYGDGSTLTTFVFLPGGSYLMGEVHDDGGNVSGHNGMERGTWSWDAQTGAVSATTVLDTNGDWGLSNSTGQPYATLSADGLQVTAHDSSPGSFTMTRVLDPGTVTPVINSALSATGTPAAPFSYTISATFNPTSFQANGLPNGLSVDTATGVISGTPTEVGTFGVALYASNTLSTSAGVTLNIQINSISCAAGSYLANPNDAACTLASLGHYVPNAGATSEIACAAGTYSDVLGASACKLADPNYFVASSGSSGQTACDVGLNSNAGAAACTDWTAPVITGTPANITTAPTGTTGAIVTYALPTANDSHDGVVAVTCVPASGSLFPKNTTTKVTCSASDLWTPPNTATTAFYVTVGVESAPVLTGVPASLAAEATSSAGAVVNYPPMAATDAWGGPLAVVCTPASGSTLPLGNTKVTCSATDVNGIGSSASFTVTVKDTTAPSWIVFPVSPVLFEATSNKGAVVSYVTPTISDLVDPVPTMKCDKPSGQTYPIGDTIVTCTAADHSGNSTNRAFTITVRDTTSPTIAISKPVNSTVYKQNQKVTANYTCSDVASGVASCSALVNGTVAVPSGGSLNTTVKGNFTFVVTAVDNKGNTSSATVNYSVQ